MCFHQVRSIITSIRNRRFSAVRCWNPNRIRVASAVVSILALNSAYGQSPGIDVEYLTRQGVEERLQSDGVGLLGDQVDMSTGSLVFRHTDVVIPGNSGLQVAVHRRRTTGRRYLLTHAFEFADWEIEAPKMTILVGQIRQGSYLQPAVWATNRCTANTFLGPKIILPWPFNPFIPEDGGSILEDYEYSNGLNLEIPGEGSKPVLDIGSSSQWPSGTEKVTTDNWAISCISDIGAANGGGQGFVATAPNGDQYTFDKLIFRKATQIDYGSEALERSTAMMLATEVTDVNGNWVRYVYSSGGILTRIHSNDGRAIDLTYVNGVIDQVIANPGANQRVWNYAYVSGQSISTKLTTVTLPDNRNWSFDLGQMDNPADPFHDCTQAGYTVSVTHPNGATGDFTFAETRHLKGDTNGNSSKSRSCQGSAASVKPFFDAMSVTQKSLSGPGYPAATWNYSYSGYTGGTVPSTKWGQVIDPLGRKSVHTFHRAGDFQGKPLKVELFATSSTSVVSQKVDYSYLAEAAVGTTYVLNENIATQRKPRRDTTTVITRGADTFTTVRTYNTTQSSSLYSHGYPTQVTTSSSASAQTRSAVTVYSHNRTQWVLGLPETITRNGKLFYDIDYDSLGRLTDYSAFGTTMQSVEYHTSDPMKGAVKWVDDALNRRTQFADYYRGRPRLITRADGTTLSRTVDINGWTISDTNPNGVTTSYAYNDVGWLTLIDRPTPYATTMISYSGLGGAFQLIATRGTERNTVYYDALTRPYLTKTEALSGGGVTSYVKTNFNSLGQEVFTSFPSTSSSPVDGVEKSYDELSRPVAVWENVTPSATTAYAYLAGNKTQVTDPSNAVAVTTTRAYGSPDAGEVVKIEQPLDVTTDMTYDNYGNMLTVRQYGTQNSVTVDQTHNYYFDNNLRLCRHSVPETGDTLYEYDAANQMTGVARGQAVGSTCATPPSGSKVVRTYNTLGLVDLVNFPGTTPDISFTYDANGNVTRNLRGTADWNYEYDVLDLLMEEELKIDGLTYRTQYAYNANAAQSSQTTPANRVIVFNPNGLGQPTGLRMDSINKDFASGMVYHPDGGLSQVTYANGYVLNRVLNPRQLVSSFKVEKGATKAAHFTYLYDANGRITDIDDLVVTGQNRDMTYDALGRLLTADGPWGDGDFVYDAIGNIRSKTLGTDAVEMQYDGDNRLSSVRETISGSVGSWQNYAYDARGNVTDNGPIGFTYDNAQQPTAMTGQAAGTFVYDGNLKRVKQTLNGKEVYSVYGIGGGLLYRDATTDGKVTDYFRAGGIDITRIVNGLANYAHNDHLGSPVSATNGVGTVLWREDYRPFGGKRQDPASNRDDIGYTGHVQDDATGLTYMQARYYDPVVGRFLSNDPVSFSKSNPFSFGRYSYANNNPYTFVDPDGRDAKSFFEDMLLSNGDTTSTPTVTAMREVMEVAKQIPSEMKSQAISGAKAIASGVDSATSEENLSSVSATLSATSVGALLGGQPQVAAVTGALSLVAAVGSAARSDSPAENIAIAVGGSIVAAKVIGTPLKIYKDVFGKNPSLLNNTVDAASEASQIALTEEIKEQNE